MRHANFVGLALADLRERAGITQREFAERLGQLQPAVARWESGARTPSLADFPRIAEALGVTPRKLAEMLDKKFRNSA